MARKPKYRMADYDYEVAQMKIDNKLDVVLRLQYPQDRLRFMFPTRTRVVARFPATKAGHRKAVALVTRIIARNKISRLGGKFTALLVRNVKSASCPTTAGVACYAPIAPETENPMLMLGKWPECKPRYTCDAEIGKIGNWHGCNRKAKIECINPRYNVTLYFCERHEALAAREGRQKVRDL